MTKERDLDAYIVRSMTCEHGIWKENELPRPKEPKLHLTDCYFYTEKRPAAMKSGQCTLTVISMNGDKATVRGTGFACPEALCDRFNQIAKVNGKTWSIATRLPTDTQAIVLVLIANG